MLPKTLFQLLDVFDMFDKVAIKSWFNQTIIPIRLSMYLKFVDIRFLHFLVAKCFNKLCLHFNIFICIVPLLLQLSVLLVKIENLNQKISHDLNLEGRVFV